MIERLLCMLGVHGPGMRGHPSPNSGCVCYCLSCGASWRSSHDGLSPTWERIR